MDTEINKNICSICKRKILKHAKKPIVTAAKDMCIVLNCTGLTNVDFELAVSNTTWFCRICNDDINPLNHLDDDDFLKAVCEMSQTIDIILKIGNESRLFHPFELNEDGNDILDYHGDLDPDKCYFNQYSQQYRNRLPWLTTGLKESIKHKNKLYQLSLRHPTVYNVTQYKRYRNMVTKLLKQQEKEYYQSQIVDNKNNLRKTWMIIKKL